MSLLNKVLRWCFVAIFILFAIVQYNDPDPMLWILVYLIFALLALVGLYKKLPLGVYGTAAFISSIWACFQWPVEWQGIGDEMVNEHTERAREALGLLICSATAVLWMLLGVKRKGTS